MNRQIIALLLSLGLASSLALSGCSGDKEKAETDGEEGHAEATTDMIVLPSEAVQRAGMTTVSVQNRAISSQIETTGEIKANENRSFHINSFVSGRITRDNVTLGDTVSKGQTLAVVQNLEVARIQADYIHELHQNEVEITKNRARQQLAQRNLERERRLLAEGISPRKDYYQAETEADLARADLEGEKEHQIHIKAEGKALLGAYGMNPGSVHSETIRTGSPVTSPRSGVIIQKNITVGDMVTPETLMYEVADLSQVWLDVVVYPKDLSRIQAGQIIHFTSDSLPGTVFMGKVNYIPPATNPESATFTARAFLNNPQGLLKPGLFGQTIIELPIQEHKPFVPDEAVQRYGKEAFIFIKLGNNRFQKQVVTIAEKVAGGYLLNSPVPPGALIVVKGSFMLKAEMLKSQFAEEE